MTAPLSPAQIDDFVREGFVRVDQAFPNSLAQEMRAILWRDAGVDPSDPASWREPAIRLGHYAQPPFRDAANTPRLRAAFDQLVGPGRWLPQGGLGTFVLRFPSPEEPGDTGWHVDVSFGTETPDFMDWRANVTSKGRALLMLFLLTDTGPDDAPTRIRVGSHRDMARLLAPAGDAGMTLRDMVAADFGAAGAGSETLATGPAGTVYLCHPLLVHSAQPNRNGRPRILAQPPLLPREPLSLDGPSPVERAIREALASA